MHQKRTKNCSILTTWRSKRTLFVLLALQNASEKDKKIVPFDYMKNGSLHKKSIFLFLSECHLSRKEGHLYFLPCQMHQKRTKQLFLLTTWRMALTTKRAITLFLSERHLSRKERHLYFLPCQMHHKRKKNCSFWVHDVQKERYLYFFSLQNASEKEKKLFLLTTWRMALFTKRAFFFPFWMSSF